MICIQLGVILVVVAGSQMYLWIGTSGVIWAVNGYWRWNQDFRCCAWRIEPLQQDLPIPPMQWTWICHHRDWSWDVLNLQTKQRQKMATWSRRTTLLMCLMTTGKNHVSTTNKKMFNIFSIFCFNEVLLIFLNLFWAIGKVVQINFKSEIYHQNGKQWNKKNATHVFTKDKTFLWLLRVRKYPQHM